MAKWYVEFMECDDKTGQIMPEIEAIDAAKAFAIAWGIYGRICAIKTIMVRPAQTKI